MIHVIQRVVKSIDVGFSAASIEKIFSSKENLDKYLESVPVQWEEQIQGISCICERGFSQFDNLYILQKCAKEKNQPGFLAITIELVFESKEKAENYLKKIPIVWEEEVNTIYCYCERSLFSLEID